MKRKILAIIISAAVACQPIYGYAGEMDVTTDAVAMEEFAEESELPGDGMEELPEDERVETAENVPEEVSDFISQDTFADESTLKEEAGESEEFGKTEAGMVLFSDSDEKICGDYKYRIVNDGAEITGYTGTETSISVPENVDGYKVLSIGEVAFSDCRGLTSIELPPGLTSIGEYAFSGCSGLRSIELPSGLTSIERYGFSGCSGLRSIELPSGLTSIGEYAFYDCRGLTSIELPPGLTSIGNLAFSWCSGLTSIELPSGLTSIQDGAFGSCSGLTSIVLPVSVARIEVNAFWNCISLKNVYYSGNKEEWDKISIDSGNTCLTQATIHYATAAALTINQVWGFSNGTVTNEGGGLELKHYLRFFAPGFANMAFNNDDGRGGLCAGMVTSAISISGHDAPPANSFILANGKNASDLHEVKSVNSDCIVGAINKLTAADYVKYAYVYQKTPLTYLEKKINKNKLDKLYTAVKKSIDGTGEYVEIAIRGEFNGENRGHLLLAMGINADNEEKTEISVYDCNVTEKLQTLILYKTNGEYTSWTYEHLNWGTGKSYSEISYTTSGNDFARDMFSNSIASIELASYKLLMSVKDNHILLQTSDGEQALDNPDELNVLEMQTYGVLLDDVSNNVNDFLYWIEGNGELQFKNGNNTNIISTASARNVVTSTIPKQTSLILNVVDNGKSYANIERMTEGDSFSIEYKSFEDESVNVISIEGVACTDKVETSKTDSSVEVKGSESLSVETVDRNGNFNSVEISNKGQAVEISDSTEGNIIVKADTNGDGAYDTIIADTTKKCHGQHTWDSGKIIKQAACSGKGIITYTCTVCGETKTEEIAATGHKYSSWETTKEATALETGVQTRACSNCGSIEKKDIEKLKATVKVNVSSIPLKVKQSTTKVKVTGLAKGDYIKSWKSSNTKVVTLNGKGKITARNKTGKATITITMASGLKKQIKVTVQKSAVATKKITGVPKSVTLKKGKTTTLKPVITPITVTSKTTYTSSNKKVATVTSKGKITAKKKGTAIITVKSGKKAAKCKVRVK